MLWKNPERWQSKIVGPEVKPIKLALKQAPLILATCFYGGSTSCEVQWPKKLSFTDYKLHDKTLKSKVAEKLDWIKRQYELLYAHKDTKALSRHVVPFLAKVNLTIVSNADDLALAIRRINALPLDYTKAVADSLSRALNRSLSEQSRQRSEGAWSKDRHSIKVVSVEPLNELELGMELYYQDQQLPWAAALEGWLKSPFDIKQSYFHDALRLRPEVVYRLELVTEPERVFWLVQSHAALLRTMQSPNPSAGYELPKKINDGGMMERCFDASYEIYSETQSHDALLAQLFSLWGHRQRALIEIKWDHLHKLHMASGRHSNLAKAILAKIAEKHSLTIESLGQPAKH